MPVSLLLTPRCFLLLLTSFLPKKQGESHYPAPTVQNIHNAPTTTAAATSVRTTSLYGSSAQYPNSPKTTVPSEKITIFFISSPTVPVLSESTGWKEHKSHTLLLSVCQHGEKLHSLSCNCVIISICLCVHCILAVRVEYCSKRLCVCMCVSTVCRQRAGCIIICTVV